MSLAALATAKAAMATNSLIMPLASAADRMVGPRGCMLTFHRAARAAEWDKLPNRDFYIDLDFLDRFLRYLRERSWDVVTVTDALRRTADADDRSRYVNFSVDDCYRDTYERVVPLFRRHNVPITLYVTTGIPDGTLPLWAAGLEDALLHRDRVAVDGEILTLATVDERRAAFASISAAWDGPEAGKRYAAFCADNGIDGTKMHWKHAISWPMLEELATDPLVEIGAHTVNHPRVATLGQDEALRELAQARGRLRERLGIAAEHFAFPYGRAADCGPRDFALARQAGFASAATTCKGLMRPGQDALSLPRNTMNGAHRHVALMEMHLKGISGVAAKVIGRV